jgi:hypothetical protein
MKYNHNPSAASCQAFYEVMADITATTGNNIISNIII